MKKIINFDVTPVILRITGSGIPPPKTPPYFTPKTVQTLGTPSLFYDKE